MAEYVSAAEKKKRLHDRIVKAIRESGMSQSQIADEIGINRQNVSAWISSYDRIPEDIKTLYWLADVLDVDDGYLLNVTDIPKMEYNTDVIHKAVKDATDQVCNIGSRITSYVPESMSALNDFFHDVRQKVELSEGYQALNRLSHTD